MNFKTIRGKLNNEFNRDGQHIVFWYDDNAEFKNEVGDISLDNAVFVSDASTMEMSRFAKCGEKLNKQLAEITQYDQAIAT